MKIMNQWPVFFLLLAFAIAPLFQGPQAGILLFIHIFLSVVFIKLFLASYENFRIPYNGLALSICAFYIWMALSISWSPAPSTSLYMLVLLSIFPLCFFIYSLKQPNDWQFLPIGILSVTLIFAFIGIGQGLFLDIGPPKSLFGTRNTYAAMMNLIALPITTYFISSKQPYNRSSILLGMILFILFFAVFQTGSKGGIVSLLLCLFSLFFISWKHIDNSSLLKVLIIVITAFLCANIQTEGLIVNRLENQVSEGALDPSISVRLLIWQSAWEIIKAAPLIGTGIGTFSTILPAIRSPALEEAVFFVHNDYLQFWLETGFVGLSLMVIIIVAIIFSFIRLLKHQGLILRDRIEISGLMAGLCAIAVHSFVDFNYYILAILMVMGLMCARIQEISIKYFPELMQDLIPAHKLSRKIFMLVAVILPFILLSYSLPVGMADHYWRIANNQLNNGQVKKAELTLKRAASWNPQNLAVRNDQFLLYRDIFRIINNDIPPIERKVHFANIILILEEIERINPLNGFVFESRGHLFVEYADIIGDEWGIKAIEEFKKALQLHPRLFRSRIALSRLLEQRGELRESVLLVNEGIRYYYEDTLTGIDEFYQYAVKLNLMNGDTVKAKEIQLAKSLLLVNQ
tara:strand:- start:59 stop:1948 length:1890 start_codon:yes stop_codon:yes gene_type:complete